MSNHRKRNQKPKGMGNQALYEAMQDIRRSNATVPHKNKTKYNRNDQRKAMQREDY